MLQRLAEAIEYRRKYPMFYIDEADVPKLSSRLLKVLKALGNGVKGIDLDMDLGNGLDSLEVIGYWVGDVIRMDIKVKR